MTSDKVRTPVANPQRLFFSRVEHGTDNKEPRRDRAFAHSQNKSHDEEAAEACAGSMGTECNSPREDVQAMHR